MGDHFVLLVDRLLTESTLEAAIQESRNRSMQATPLAVDDSKADYSSPNVEFGDISTPRKLVECRICQDEDADSNMETPCSCCGSLKQFKPGYTAPPPLFQFGNIPMNFRGNWEISRRELNNPRIIMVAADHSFLQSPTYEEYSASNTRSMICCRSIALIFMFLLILRHTLPVILSRTNDYSFPMFLQLFLRTAGIVLPIYVMVKAVTALQRRRYQQVSPNSSFTSSDSDEETEQSSPQPRGHVLHVH
ncbi:ring-ch-type domain-containing protein [Citrus sinensis]|uniref:Ring-ch-type domain-containing protein n=1 Tax=Citrus sinensis TaxID=2711 RepID=A0ACB8NAZ4_CITSI|nr:ring-ch-type domain-containing protein [Citrus sinensis]